MPKTNDKAWSVMAFPFAILLAMCFPAVLVILFFLWLIPSLPLWLFGERADKIDAK